MAIGLITHLDYIREDIIDTLNNSGIGFNSAPYYQSPEWKPPIYTSMTAWYLLNYLLLAVLISIPILAYLWLKSA